MEVTFQIGEMKMSQAAPTYPYATGKAEKPIVDALVAKYGANALTWPIVLSQTATGATQAYLYERNAKNQINAQGDIRPQSTSGLPEHFLDYTSTPRLIAPPAGFLQPLVAPQFPSSYEYILQQQVHSTVDLDYVWHGGIGFKGFELTTFYVQFTTEAKAREVVSKMNRRPSWQGPNGAHAMHKIADAAADLNVDYYLVCANTAGEVGSPLNTQGNVLRLPMTHASVDALSNGHVPPDATFCTFRQFLAWL
jgi:hypothetical protein